MRAHRLAKAGDLALATGLFALVRQSVLAQANEHALAVALAENWAVRVAERDAYRDILAKQGTRGKSVAILDASSGLPRPDRMDTAHLGAEVTYPWLLATRGFQPVSLSQRNVTTSDVLDILNTDPSILQSDAAIIHLGLNDCANRIFSHRERMALSLLRKRLRYQIVGFAKAYRRAILHHLPARHYVPLDGFRRNLDLIIARLQAGGVKTIVLTTIITPHSSRWAATPGVNANFARYNQEIIKAAARNDVILFELDRMALEGGHADMVIADGMHLSDAGNQRYVDRLVPLLAGESIT